MFMTSMAARYGLSFSYFFFSVVLGAVAMGFFWYYLPDEFVQLQRSASAVRDFIAAHAWSTRAESIIRFLLEDRQLLLITFVVVTRLVLGIVLSLVVLPIRALFHRS